MTLHVTSVNVLDDEADPWMPAIEVYMAMAEALHYETEQCEESVDFDECIAREADIKKRFASSANFTVKAGIWSSIRAGRWS